MCSQSIAKVTKKLMVPYFSLSSVDKRESESKHRDRRSRDDDEKRERDRRKKEERREREIAEREREEKSKRRSERRHEEDHERKVGSVAIICNNFSFTNFIETFTNLAALHSSRIFF